MAAPGMPMIFQGQEFLEDEYFRESDPLDWTKRDRFAGSSYQSMLRRCDRFRTPRFRPRFGSESNGPSVCSTSTIVSRCT